MDESAEREAAILRSVRCSLRLISSVCSQLRDSLPGLIGDRPTEAQRQTALELDAALTQAAKTAGTANLALGSLPVEPNLKHYAVFSLSFSQQLDRQLAAQTQPQRRQPRRRTGKFLIAYKSRIQGANHG